MRVRRTVVGGATVVVALVLFWLSAVPQAQEGRRGSKPQLYITTAVPDVVNGELVIGGVNLGAAPGQVSVAGLEVGPILGWSATQIIVPLPAFPPGSYLLTVVRDWSAPPPDDDGRRGNGGPSVTDFNVFHVTLGAVGPKGDRGDKGDQGAQGEPGNPGAQGEKGDKGDKGDTGEKGAKGDQGDRGIQGIQGIQGNPGPQGPAGLLASPCTSVGGTAGTIKFVGPLKTLVCADGASANGRFIDFGLVILDTQTNLMWEKKTTAVGSGQNVADLHDVDNKYTWCAATGNSAAGFCAGNATSWIGQVNAEVFAGFSNWRVPTKDELLGILDCGAGAPCVNPIFGPTQAAFQAAYYWSSTEGGGHASLVDFNSGNAFVVNKTNFIHVRAVRAGP